MLAGLLLSCVLVLEPLPEDGAPFRWSESPLTHGPVVDTGVDWEARGRRRQRAVPGWAGGATYQLLLHAEEEGGPTERALLQVPAELEGRRVPLVVAFHGFGRTEREVFLDSDLPAACAKRGWALLAPYGLSDNDCGTPESRTALADLIGQLDDLVPLDRRRVLVVGHGLGAGSALRFAADHQDPRGLRVAGAVCHTPMPDLGVAFERGDERLRSSLIHSMGGTPKEVPKAYARSSAAGRMLSGLIDPSRAPLVHLQDVPIVLHANLADPDADRLADCLEVARFLQARGARVVEDLVFEPQGSGWRTLGLEAALDRLATSLDVGVPRNMDICADRPGQYGHVHVRKLDGDARGRARVEVAPGRLSVTGTRGLHELAIDLALTGTQPNEPVHVTWSSADGSEDRLVLIGYLRMPSAVHVDGVPVPGRRWSWNEEQRELLLLLDPGGLRLIEVLP
ncbi:MAG: hypothetical protein O2816_03870 [Planctomycetota bacterium]|nr:hypothetical protein [Planctomycetota bacterium]